MYFPAREAYNGNNMKIAFTTFLIFSFIGVAVFGIFSMHADTQNHDGGCIAMASQGKDCPKQINPFDYTAFHLNAFRGFSTTTFNNGFSASLLLLFLLVAGMGVGVRGDKLISQELSLATSHRPGSELFDRSQKYKFLRWLSLHENSPAAL